MLKIKILTWNDRGANYAEKRKMIKAFLRSQIVDLICLQKTKLKGMSSSLVRSLSAGRFVDWATSNAVGVLRGYLIFWNSKVL